MNFEIKKRGMMNFKKYYFNESISWNKLTKDNDELKAALEVMHIIKDVGYESLIVGGFVRDVLMGKESSDVDIATNMPQEKIKELFDTINVGESFGVNIVKHRGHTFEVAQYRKDMYDNLDGGKGADTVEIASDFKDDSSRRDFTINSLGIDIDGNVVDHHGGIQDIENKVITTVGDPNIRFKEDALRTLRGVRFASRLGFKIDDKTMAAIKSHSPKIKDQAVERIMKEISKMAEQSGSKFADAIVMLKDAGLLKYILPEVLKMDEFEHNVEHHPEGNVFYHTLSALRSSDVVNPIVNLSILLHDVGKIETYTKDETGHHYFGHAQKSSELIDKIADRLKLDNKTRESLKFSAMNHMKFHELLDISPSKVMKMIEDPNWDILVSVAQADAKARGELFDENEWSLIMKRVDELKERFKGKQATDKIRRIVNGKLVMDLLNMKGGPELGDIIKKTVGWIIDNNIDIEDMDSIKNKILELGGKK
ncbi:MAG: CCA tRNA nucleotidyltransferase [bacterium]